MRKVTPKCEDGYTDGQCVVVNTCVSGMDDNVLLDDFLNEIWKVIESQNKVITHLKNQVDILRDEVRMYGNEVRDLM